MMSIRDWPLPFDEDEPLEAGVGLDFPEDLLDERERELFLRVGLESEEDLLPESDPLSCLDSGCESGFGSGFDCGFGSGLDSGFGPAVLDGAGVAPAAISLGATFLRR